MAGLASKDGPGGAVHSAGGAVGSSVGRRLRLLALVWPSRWARHASRSRSTLALNVAPSVAVPRRRIASAHGSSRPQMRHSSTSSFFAPHCGQRTFVLPTPSSGLVRSALSTGGPARFTYCPVVPPTIAAEDPTALDATAAALRAGGAVILPTETVYGVGVAALVPGATERIFALKGRPSSVPLAVLVDSLEQALELCEAPAAPVARLVERLWPGPLTVVLARRGDVAVELGGDGATVGIRCPDHAFVRALARRLGPLATTSANRHGEPTPALAADAAASLLGEVALVVDGGPCAGVASTVVDGTSPELRVLREGPISSGQVQAAALP